MSQISDKNQGPASDGGALIEFGRALAAHRVRLNITQQKLAAEAGVSRSTVARLEAGESVQLSVLIRLLRALGLLERLGDLVPPTEISPVQVLENDGKVRRRASSAREQKEQPKQDWTWGDEQ